MDDGPGTVTMLAGGLEYSMVLTPLVIVIGLLIGLLRGGRLSAMTANRVAAWPLLGAGIVIQTIGETLDVPGRAMVVAVGFICMVGAAMRNVHIPGAAVSGIGVTLNLAVLVVNGHVPVRFEALTGFGNDVVLDPASTSTGLWQLENDDTSLAFLGDIVPVPFLGTAISFGDIIMLAGLMVIAMNVVLQGRSSGIAVDDLFGDDRLATLPPEAVIHTTEVLGVGIFDEDPDLDLREEVVLVPRPERTQPPTELHDSSDCDSGDLDVRRALFDDVDDTINPQADPRWADTRSEP